MIGLDTNVLVRYDVEDDADAETTRQREAARTLVDGGRPCAVSITVVLELEWVLRGHYGFDPADVMRALRHLLSVPWVNVGGREVVERAIDGAEAGLDLADALHHATYRDCTAVVTFDDRRFARRARRLAMRPAVTVLGALPGG